jgi:class 3 adenylate cyclase
LQAKRARDRIGDILVPVLCGEWAHGTAMNDRAVNRRLTAVLAADLVGYSRLMGIDEVGTLARLTRLRRDLIDPAIAGCRGRIVKTTGDGLLLAFGSIVDATRCAILIQHGIAERSVAAGETGPMRFRIGVNIGDVILEGDDIFGDCVNIAARLETLAEPGGICISKSAHDQVRGKIKADFVDIGAHEVKNIARPVEVMALPPAAIAAIPAAELALDPPASRRPLGKIVSLIAVLCLVGAAGTAYYFKREVAQPLDARATAALDRLLPNLPSKARERAVLDYLASASHRAFAVAPNAHSRWWTADWPSRETAIEKVLERCQLYFNEPCAAIMVDEELMAPGADGTFATSDMPRVHYGGTFDPDQIPGVRSAIAKRPDVLGYGAVAGPKAAALHVRGAFKVVTSAVTQRGAEVQALKACNDDPASRKTDGPCYLYAAGNDVVLLQRLNAPLTPR